MGELGGLLRALAIGVPLLILAVWLDAKHQCWVEGEPARDPEEGNPGYLTQSKINGLPAPGIRCLIFRTEPRGERLEVGLVDPGSADMSGRVDLRDANVLVIDGTGVIMWELMTPISRRQPLVLVAREMDEDVSATLVANQKSLTMPLAVVITDLIPEVADLAGALLISVTDLRVEYLPAEHPGYITRWVTDDARTWIEPHSPLVGTTQASKSFQGLTPPW